MRHLKVILFSLFTILALQGFAQRHILSKSIYFETGKYILSDENKAIISGLVDSLLKFDDFHITINGNTDNIGDSIHNRKLSEQRVLTTKQYFIEKGVNKTIFSTAAYGSGKPVADNKTDEGKRKNRRVDISISYTLRPVMDVFLKETPSILELYRITVRKPQEFCVHPDRDTVLRCEKGTIVYVKANSFRISGPCKSNCVTIKIKEDFLKSEMLLDNLSTTSNGKIIESQGMVFTEATDCNGNPLTLVNKKDLVIMLPTDKVEDEAKIFKGERTGTDSQMNWRADNKSVLSHYTLKQLIHCHDILCGGVRDRKRCPLFFCGLKEFFGGLFAKKGNNDVAQPRPLSKEDQRQCGELEEMFKKYGTRNMTDLLNAINKPLLDSFHVKTIAQLEDTFRKLNKNNIELAFLNKRLNFNDFKYYIYNTSKLGWSNIDRLAKLTNTRVTMKLNLKPANNIDAKLAFKTRRIVIPGSSNNQEYIFENAPKGELVWIVALKYDEGKAFLSLQDATIDEATYDIDFKQVSLEELKEKLKILDR